MVAFSKFGIAAAALISSTVAHPGDTHDEKLHEAMRNHASAFKAKRALDACASNPETQALQARNIARRSQVAQELRQKRGIHAQSKKFRRDLATLEAFEVVNHNHTGIANYDPNTPESMIFGANTSCIVTPEVTDGPYYVTGEMIRKNVIEDEYCDGVELYLEAQYIDINTCRPVPNIYVDIWQANATGVYSGISESGNYAADGLNSTYLRGIQPTDDDGVAAFETIFPGHYDGRATHTHLLAHMNVTVYANDTIGTTNNITHIGQVFYVPELRAAVEEVYPYSTNDVAITSNDDDMWSVVQADTYYDPFAEFIYLGDDVSEGLLAWVQIGVNVSANYIDDDYYAVAANLYADGGHVSSNALGNMGGGGGGGNMTGGNMTGGNMTGGNMTGGNMTGGNMTGGNMTGSAMPSGAAAASA